MSENGVFLEQRGAALLRTLSRIFRTNHSMSAGAGLLLVIVIGAIVGPNVVPYGPEEMHLEAQHQPPSLSHPFGTDFFGRDIVARSLYGARNSLIIGLVVVSINMLFGVAVGLVSGYRGGWIDNVLMRITDIFLSFPALLFALAIVAIRGPGLDTLIMALTLKGWTTFARLTRSQVLSLKEMEFVQAARSIGAGSVRILIRHLLVNSLSVIIVYASLAISVPILSEAALSFLGLGLPPPTPSLGSMLAAERSYMRQAWWGVTFPGLMIIIMVLGFNLFGDGVRDTLDPKSGVT